MTWEIGCFELYCICICIGGGDSLIRIWNIHLDESKGIYSAKMLSSLREHQNKISSIKISSDNTEFVTSSYDGSCVIWDLKKLIRINAFFNSATQFTSVLYQIDQSQFLTCGSDRQISYWDAVSSEQIRVVIASKDSSINAMDIDKINGNFFITVSDDRLVKLWHYDEGICYNIGHGHSGKINDVKVSPDSNYAVSVGNDYGIFIWKIPQSIKDHNLQL